VSTVSAWAPSPHGRTSASPARSRCRCDSRQARDDGPELAAVSTTNSAAVFSRKTLRLAHINRFHGSSRNEGGGKAQPPDLPKYSALAV